MIEPILELRFQREMYNKGLSFALFDKTGRGRSVSVEMEYTKEGEIFETPTKPLFFLRNDKIQELFQGLWDEGFRPDHDYGTEGHRKSTEKHLDDMRKIAGKYLEINLGD